VCQGDVRNGPIESIEMKCPVLIEERALRCDSGGAGKYRGGIGLDVRVRNLVEGQWNFEQTRRSMCPPWGLWGGQAGDYNEYLLRQPGENDFAIAYGNRRTVPVNSEAIVRTGGGGGWGDPLERDAQAVHADVIAELVSRDAARTEYGVVIRPDLSLDAPATARLRDEMRSGQPS
jgi:N-methylhydantoinase B